MSVNEFWEDNPDYFWAYRFSYYNNLKAEEHRMNFQLWLQGAYFHEAVAVALANSFGKGKKVSYAEKPYNLSKEDEEAEYKKKQEQLEKQIKNRISQVQALMGDNKDKKALKKGESGEK